MLDVAAGARRAEKIAEKIGGVVAKASRRGARDGAGNGRGAPPRDASLHHAPPSLGRDRVVEIQRLRMLNAMIDLAHERGAERVTVAHVVARAGVSRRTFYELFADRETCLLAALDEAVDQLGAAVLPAYQSERDWLARIRAGLTAMLTFFDEQPGIAALCVVDVLGAGPQALERRARVLETVVGAVDRGRREPSAPKGLGRVSAEGVVGAVLGVLHTRLREGDPKPLLTLRGQLMNMIVLPYLGPEAAVAELALRPPRPHAGPRARTDPLKDLDIRLTYRTMRVLSAVAERPGLNNRGVGREAGVVDQGQISKLLARLESIGLLVNTGDTGRGEAKAWNLTERGRELEQTIRARVHQ
jgi:AcrR family transcriptional regulator/DNA-binding MarR family transcriptional regulator